MHNLFLNKIIKAAAAYTVDFLCVFLEILFGAFI